MESYTHVDGPVHQQSQTTPTTTDPSTVVNTAPSLARHSVTTAIRGASHVTTPYLDRMSNRNSTPFPDLVETENNSSLPFNLANSAANTSLQLRQQLNLMAQALAIQNAPSAASTFPLVSQQSATNSATHLRGANSSTISNMLDQYISAIQHQQLQLANLVVAPNSQQIPSVSSNPSTNFTVPLAAYLQPASSSQSSPMGAAIQLLQQAQDNNSSSLGQTSDQSNPTMLNSLLSALCHCDILPVNPNINTCPLHGPQQNSDGNNNSRRSAANGPLVTGVEVPVQINSQRQQAPILVNQMTQQRQQSNGIIQHQPSNATVGLAAAIQSHRMNRSSLKRPSNGATSGGVAAITGPNEDEGVVLSGTATTAVHISSPPPLLISPNATSIRLSSGLNVAQSGDGGGPSRGPKLRRLASFGEINSQTQLHGQVATTELSEFRSPSVASASSAATNVAAAIVQLQQQAAVAAAIPSTVTFLSSLANGTPSSTAIANSQQSIGDTSLSSLPSIVQPVVDSTAVSLAADLGSAVSLSTGVEQLVAAAINTATFPQTIAAMAAASAFPSQNVTAPPPYAVCAAAAACHQSRMGPSMAATVTACSCLHHHHHLHCHHNNVVPTPFPAVYTLCNHVAAGTGSPSPSSNATISQPLQTQHSLNSTNNLNNSCISATGTSIVGNSNGNNRIVANTGSSSLQSAPQIGPIAQRYLAMNSSAFMSNGSNNVAIERIPLTNNVSANVNIHATSGGSTAMVAAAALTPSNVTAMLLNSAAAMGQQQQQNSLPQLVQAAPYSLRNLPMMGDLSAAQQSLPNMTSMQQTLLATRFMQQEREREVVNQFYQQQQQNHLVRPLIMVPRLSSHDLANVLLLHNPGSVDDAATLVLNGGSSVTSALAHATNPHHIVANAMATATAPEPQPVGVSLEQIKKHSQKLSYVKDPDVPEQERDRCTVCLSDFETGDELRALNCTHLFHTECIDRWLQYNKKCPVCRVDMDKGGAGSSAMAAEATVMLNAYAAAAAASTTTNTTAC